MSFTFVILPTASPAFETLLRIARPVLTKSTTDTWSIHGTNKRHWTEAIREVIEPDQIRPQFGGTKMDVEDIDNFY